MQDIRQFISTIQGQPVRVRQTILLVASGSIMALIVIVWISTLSSSLSGAKSTAQNTSTEAPFSLVTDVIKESYASAISGFKTIKQ